MGVEGAGGDKEVGKAEVVGESGQVGRAARVGIADGDAIHCHRRIAGNSGICGYCAPQYLDALGYLPVGSRTGNGVDVTDTAIVNYSGVGV